MSKAWMPLYVADYLADTGHFDHEEHGVYILCIMHYWQTGKPLPTERKQLLSICRCFASERFDQIWCNVSKCFELVDHRWVHHRIDKELEKTRQLSEKRRESGKQGGRKKTVDGAASEAIAPANALQLPTQSQSQSPLQSLKEEPIKTLSATADVALEIILADETMHPITHADVKDWINMFPKVDVVEVLSKIVKTCQQYPTKRKNGDGVRDHIVGCLQMMQERVERFQEIWDRYPHKVGRKESERHFWASIHTEDDYRDMHKALDHYLDFLALPENSYRRPQDGKTWFNNWKEWVKWERSKTKQRGLSDGDERAFLEAG